MTDLARKLGLKPGQKIGLFGLEPDLEQRLRRAAPTQVRISTSSRGLGFDLIFVQPRSARDLPGRFTRLQSQIVPDGAVWAVLPKREFAAARRTHLSWREVQAAALTTDLVDNKEASLSPELYATRFVIRRQKRPTKS